ncbi:hypothetical protein AB1Y20_016304 [Prymnesium parvum]|uniref:Tyrosine-protein kinase ephrin type A/B receptor-like domain-containing protein n=1 Tax=Prymnesium parvum TaxID=97485 RepID=A0AB34IED9_PRYPA
MSRGARLALLHLLASPHAALASTPCSTLCPPTGDCTLSNATTAPPSAPCVLRGAGHLTLAAGASLSCEAECSILIDFDGGITVGHAARISAGTVRLRSQRGQLTIASAARVDADGRGSCGRTARWADGWLVTSGDELTGAGHGGNGGQCSGSFPVEGGAAYGDGTDPEKRHRHENESALYGSGTEDAFDGSTFCCGGGYVHLSAPRLQLDGAASADAQLPCLPPDERNATATPLCPPCAANGTRCAGLAGASGGTVILRAAWFNGTGSASARGAPADGVCRGGRRGGGGAGGRVQVPASALDHVLGVAAAFAAHASGGATSSPQCEVGSAGTVLYNSEKHRSLIVDSEEDSEAGTASFGVTAGTVISQPPPARVINELRILNGAVVVGQQRLDPALTALVATDSIRLDNNAVLQLPAGHGVQTCGSLVLTRSSVIMRASTVTSNEGLSITAGSLSCDSRSWVSEVQHVVVNTTAVIECALQTRARMQLRVGELLVLATTGTIAARQLQLRGGAVHAAGRIQVTESVISSSNFTINCTGDETPHFLNMHVGSLELKRGGRIWGSAILISCKSSGKSSRPGPPAPPRTHTSTRTHTHTTLATPHSRSTPSFHSRRSMGYGAELGPGGGCVTQEAGAGSGGGHGGAGGGSSGNYSCGGGLAYDHAYHPTAMGSGGGGACAGSGGGIIQLHVEDDFVIGGLGSIEADGGDAECPDEAGPADGSGSGGGAGGAIVVEAARFQVSQDLDQDWRGWISDSDWSVPPSDELSEAVWFTGGSSGDGCDHDCSGAEGNVTGPVCGAGHAGPLCQPCAAGYAKRSSGRYACERCAAGQYSAQPGSSSCDVCSAGTATDAEGSSSCAACLAGSYSPANGSTACAACAAGKVAAHGGATACDECAGGSRALSDGKGCTPCLAGKYRPPHSAAAECDECPPGAISNASAANCTACASLGAGLAQNAWGGTACSRCAAGEEAVGGICRPCDCPLPAHATLLRVGFCEWQCTPPYVTLDGLHCASTVDALLHALTPTRVALLLSPVLIGFFTVVVFLLLVRSAFGRRGSKAMSKGLLDTSLRNLLRVPHTSLSHESLEHAISWEQHKYRAKQHVSRLYVSGENIATQPWRLPPLPPPLRKMMVEREYYRLAEEFNSAAAWKQWELVTHSVLCACLPPLAVHFIRMRRRVHFRRVLAVVQSYSSYARAEQLWRSIETRVFEGHRLEVSCCAQYALGWIDIFLNVGGGPLLAPAYCRRLSGANVLSAAAPPEERGSASGWGRQLAASSCRPIQQAFKLVTQTSNVSASFPCADASPPSHPALQLLSPVDSASPSTPPSLRLPVVSSGKDTPRQREDSPANGNGLDARGHSDEVDSCVNLALTWGYAHRNDNAHERRRVLSAGSNLTCRIEGTPTSGLSGELRGVSPPDHVENIPAGRDEDLEEESLRTLLAAGASRNEESQQEESPEIRHAVYLCGKATFLSPLWIEIDDFKAYVALHDTLSLLSPNCALVVASLNTWLLRLNRWSSAWRGALCDTLLLLEAINASNRAHSTSAVAPALALVHLPSEELSKQFLLLGGVGDPSQWPLPPYAQLLRSSDFSRSSSVKLADMRAPPWFLEALIRVLIGTVQPHPLTRCAALLLLLLLLCELGFQAFTLGMICAAPEQVSYCCATVLCLPFAGIISPLLGLACLMRATYLLARAAAGDQRALSRASSASVGRMLHISAAWNAASLPNAFVAFVSLVSADEGAFITAQPWLIPLALFATKILVAQGHKLLAASSNMSGGAYAFSVDLSEPMSASSSRAFVRTHPDRTQQAN